MGEHTADVSRPASGGALAGGNGCRRPSCLRRERERATWRICLGGFDLARWRGRHVPCQTPGGCEFGGCGGGQSEIVRSIGLCSDERGKPSNTYTPLY